jgi:hypothetical protein
LEIGIVISLGLTSGGAPKFETCIMVNKKGDSSGGTLEGPRVGLESLEWLLALGR